MTEHQLALENVPEISCESLRVLAVENKVRICPNGSVYAEVLSRFGSNPNESSLVGGIIGLRCRELEGEFSHNVARIVAKVESAHLRSDTTRVALLLSFVHEDDLT